MKQRKHLALLSFVFVLLVGGIAGYAGQADLIVLHTNDIHGRIEVDEDILGFPYISSLVQYYRAQYEHVLVLDAGDALHGQPITTVLEGESAVVSMNIVGYDVMVPGNHDFNFGYQRLLELEEEYMEFDLVGANVFKEGELLFTPYVIKEVGDFTVGIFGLVTSQIATHPRNIEGLEFGDITEAATRCVSALRDDHNVDLVIALGHVGLNYSSEVAAQVEGIDLFVDGHSHSLLLQGEWVGNTLIVQAHEYGKYLGKVEVDLSGETPVMEASLISAEVGRELVDPDEELIELLEEFREEILRRMFG